MTKLKLIGPAVLVSCLVSDLFLSNGADARSFADSINSTEDSFGYCTVRTGSKTERAHVVSSVFKVKDGTFAVGVQNSPLLCTRKFRRRSRLVTRLSYQEVADSSNAWVGRLRSDGLIVYTVSWSYRGD